MLFEWANIIRLIRSLSGVDDYEPGDRLGRMTPAPVKTIVKNDSKTVSEVNELREDLYRMALFVQTLVNALLEKGVVTEDRLNEIMTEVDLSDGVADGQLTRPKDINDLRKNGVECPRCARLNRKGRRQCLYCGADMPSGGEWLKI